MHLFLEVAFALGANVQVFAVCALFSFSLSKNVFVSSSGSHKGPLLISISLSVFLNKAHVALFVSLDMGQFGFWGHCYAEEVNKNSCFKGFWFFSVGKNLCRS